MPQRTFTVIAYDIADDRRRLRVATFLEGVADRVQASVFEGYLDRATLQHTIRKVRGLIDPAKDTVRFYRLCATCLAGLRVLGTGGVEGDPETIVL